MTEGVPTIESVLRRVRSSHLRVNNLFHRMDGMWQANLRSSDAMTFFEFGYGPDAAGALEAALAKVIARKCVKGRRTGDDDLDATQVGIVRHEVVDPTTDSVVADVHVAFSPAVAQEHDEDDLIG